MTDSLFVTLVNPGPLTKRESLVLSHLCKGKTRKETARSVYRSVSTVSRAVERIAEKLNARSTAEIVAKAVADGLVNIARRSS